MDIRFGVVQRPFTGGVRTAHPAGRRLVPRGRADLHVHTLWSDGAQHPRAVVEAASGRVDVVAVTDHDEIRGALEAREFARANPALEVDVVVGEEVSTRNGHLIGLYLEERVPPGLTAERTIELIHEQGGLAVAAHPYHPIRYNSIGHPSLATLLDDLPIGAIEIVNNSGIFSPLYDAWAALRNVEWMLPVVAGSDAPDVWYLGSALTRFEGADAGGLRRALAAGRTHAQRSWSWTIDKLPPHFRIQWRSFLRFVSLGRRQSDVSWAE